MRYWFEIKKLDGSFRKIASNSLDEIKRKKNNYRRSPWFQGAYISQIRSEPLPFKISLGDMVTIKRGGFKCR